MLERLVTLRYSYLNHQREENIANELEKYLESINRKDIFQNLNYVLKEFASNANKANLKRVHFNIKNLDINTNDDYKKGIKDFRDDLTKNHDTYHNFLEKSGYFVRLDFYVSKGFLVYQQLITHKYYRLKKKDF